MLPARTLLVVAVLSLSLLLGADARSVLVECKHQCRDSGLSDVLIDACKRGCQNAKHSQSACEDRCSTNFSSDQPSELAACVDGCSSHAAIAAGSSTSAPLECHCLNGGLCQALTDASTRCECPEGFTGALCEIQITSSTEEAPSTTAAAEETTDATVSTTEENSSSSVIFSISTHSTEAGSSSSSELATTPEPASASSTAATTSKASTQAACPCLNGGVCDDSSSGSGDASGDAALCVCAEGFTGELCEDKINPTGSTPVIATAPTVSSEVISTPEPQNPTSAGSSTAASTTQQSCACLNGGSCAPAADNSGSAASGDSSSGSDSGAASVCACPSGFHGDLCEFQGNPVVTPCNCLNGGACVIDWDQNENGNGSSSASGGSDSNSSGSDNSDSGSSPTGHHCECAAEYYGPQCEFLVVTPPPSATTTDDFVCPCINGGFCLMIPDDAAASNWQCVCTVGFTGTLCESAVPQGAPLPGTPAVSSVQGFPTPRPAVPNNSVVAEGVQAMDSLAIFSTTTPRPLKKDDDEHWNFYTYLIVAGAVITGGVLFGVIAAAIVHGYRTRRDAQLAETTPLPHYASYANPKAATAAEEKKALAASESDMFNLNHSALPSYGTLQIQPAYIPEDVTYDYDILDMNAVTPVVTPAVTQSPFQAQPQFSTAPTSPATTVPRSPSRTSRSSRSSLAVIDEMSEDMATALVTKHE